MTTKRAYNPHKWFFAYVQTLANYDKDFAKEIRAGIVAEYSNNENDSLSDMYKNNNYAYMQMKYSLLNKQHSELDKARKRLIAVLFSYMKFKGYKASMQYVKSVAVNASGASDFNAISMAKLIELYRIFGQKKTKEVYQWVDGILDKVASEFTI